MAVCTAWHDSPNPPYDTLGLVTLTFVLEKRKRLHPRSQTFATAVSNVCNCHRKRLRERLQSTEYFWIISLRISSTPSCICSNKTDVRSLCILWAHSLSSCASFPSAPEECHHDESYGALQWKIRLDLAPLAMSC